MDLQVRIGVIFVAEKRLQQSKMDCCIFCYAAGVRPPCTIAPAAYSANQLNIAYGYRVVIR